MAAHTLHLNGHPVVLMDTVASIAPEHSGQVVVTGSHGGLGSARNAIHHPPLFVVFNDAGIGKDAAGTAGLDLLAQFGIAAATVSAESARIGDAEDTLENGRVSYVNAPAMALGVEPGLGVKQAIGTLVPRIEP